MTRLTEENYADLRRLAGRYMRSQRPDHTLQPTALVHEAYLRLAHARGVAWAGRTHFVAAAAAAMRSVLIDSARRRRATKREGGARVTLVDGSAIAAARAVDVLALDEALTRLASADARAARVVELRFFGGLELEEVAEVLAVSLSTVKRDWRYAKAWLGRALCEGAAAAS